MLSKLNRKGFVLAEFAIALPLLILLGFGLANIGIEIFRLGKIQLADYVLENEAQYVMERITHQARAAKEIEVSQLFNDIDQLTIVYHTVGNRGAEYSRNFVIDGKVYYTYFVFDVRETQYYIPRGDSAGNFVALNAKRVDSGSLSNPITGENYFGMTKINLLKYKFDSEKKILHITLEMESFVSGHKIKLVTAVFMPGLEA